MKRKSILKGMGLLIIIGGVILSGCVESTQETTPAPTTTTPSEKELVTLEEYPSVYLTNDVSALPLATSGYDIYLIGEQHGTQEIHQLFLEYLAMLHESIGLQDVILEANEVAEEEANAYVHGGDKDAAEVLWNRPDRFDVLEGIHEINEDLPKDEKIRAHLVDVDFPSSHIYTHIRELKEEIGADIELSSEEEFEAKSKNEMVELVDTLMETTDEESVIHELSTVKTSILVYYAMSSSGNEKKKAIERREETIARNIQYIRNEIDNAPVLVLYGHGHVCKSSEAPIEKPWAHRLTASGVSIYAVAVEGIAGHGWRSTVQRGASEQK